MRFCKGLALREPFEIYPDLGYTQREGTFLIQKKDRHRPSNNRRSLLARKVSPGYLEQLGMNILLGAHLVFSCLHNHIFSPFIELQCRKWKICLKIDVFELMTIFVSGL